MLYIQIVEVGQLGFCSRKESRPRSGFGDKVIVRLSNGRLANRFAIYVMEEALSSEHISSKRCRPEQLCPFTQHDRVATVENRRHKDNPVCLSDCHPMPCRSIDPKGEGLTSVEKVVC